MLSLHLFGGPTILDGTTPVVGPSTQRRRLALLALLGASPRGTVGRDKLVAYLWPERNRESARHFLADSVFAVRKHLGRDVIHTVGDDLSLNEEALGCDVRQFSEALKRGELETAIALYQGPFLDGFFVSDVLEFERWMESERSRLAQDHAEAIETLAVRADDRKDTTAAVQWWRRRAALDPLNPRVAIRLMLSLDAAGERFGALQHARVYAALNRDEFGSEPDPEVEALAQQLAGKSEKAVEAKTPEPSPAPENRSSAVGTGVPATPGASSSQERFGSAFVVPEAGALAAGSEPAAEAPHVASPFLRRPPLAAVLGLTLVLGALVIVSYGWVRALSAPPPPPTSVSQPRQGTLLAVFPFRVRGNPEFEYLGEGIVTLLSTTLDGAENLSTVDPNVLLNHPGYRGGLDLPIAPSVAAGLTADLGGDMYLLGTLVESGGSLRIAATLYGSQGARVTLSASGNDVLALVDEISRQILVELLGTPIDARLAHLAARTSGSVPALRKYLDGEREFRAARYDEALTSLREAVREDPTFALAHYRLSTAAEWSQRFAEARQAATEAVRHSERLSPGDQQLTAAWHDFVNGDADEAERRYLAVLAEDPDDVEAWSGLGEVQAHYNPVRGRPVQEASAAFREVLRLAPNYGEARFHLLEVAAASGRVEGFDSLLASVDSLSPQWLSWRAARAFAWGSEQDVQSLTPLLGEASEIVVGIAAARAAAHFLDLDAAEALAQLLTEPVHPESWRAAGHLLIAVASLARGSIHRAETELALVREIEPGWAIEIEALGTLLPTAEPDPELWRTTREELAAWEPGRSTPGITFLFATHADVHAQLRLYLLALLSIRLGDEESAERYRTELARTGRTDEGRALSLSLSRSVQAHAAWQRGDPEEALSRLDQARLRVPIERIALSPFFAESLDRYLRAEALAALDQNDEALRWLASLTEGTELLFRAPAHELQSELYAATGEPEQARRHDHAARAFRAGVPPSTFDR